ncbi:MAG: hypothetical protein JW997_06660 [Actinobacteria bacterium]|nr:hypothetical protein [Actinomycetota bacterium]
MLKGSEATIKFFTEWSLIADKLYDKFPFRKIRIPNPQDNWELAMDKIRDFLDIKKQTI